MRTGERAKAAPQRGRPKLDLALRARNLMWYWLLRAETGLGDDQLDRAFAHPNPDLRTRSFYKIRSGASSPDTMRGYRGHESLLDRVHRQGRYADIYRAFASPLWRILSNRQMTVDDFRQIIAAHIDSKGWFRFEDREAKVATRIWGKSEPALESGVGPVTSAMLHHLIEARDIDCIALLCALFREAHGLFAIEHAAAYAEAVRTGIAYFLQVPKLPNPLAGFIGALIQDRVIENVWINEGEFDVPDIPTRGKQIAAIMMQYQLERYARRNQVYPIVLRNDQLDWVAGNTPRLIDIGNRIRGLQAEILALRMKGPAIFDASLGRTIGVEVDAVDASEAIHSLEAQIAALGQQTRPPPGMPGPRALPVMCGADSIDLRYLPAPAGRSRKSTEQIYEEGVAAFEKGNEPGGS